MSGDESVPDRIEGKFKAAVICWILGTGAAFTWNSMLSISDYYYYIGSPAPTLQHHPSRVLTLVYQPVALGTMMLLTYHEAKLSTYNRILCGYTISGMCALVLMMVNALAPMVGNYIGFCVFVGILGVCDALVQGGIIGDLFFMDPTFLQSFLAGLTTSGVLTSMLRIFMEADKTNDGPVLSLFISAAYVAVCLIVSEELAKIPIVKHYLKKAALEGSKTVLEDLHVAGVSITIDVHHQNVSDAQDPDRLSKKALICQNLDLALDLWLIYALTFSIFPGFLFKNIAHNQLGSWYGVVLMALYNIFDLIGRCVTLVESMKLESRKGLMIACLSRLLLIPCFYFTAMYGGQRWMINLLVPFLGLTNGYLTVSALVVAPRGYRAPEQNALGNLLFVFLLGGAFSGVVLDYF